MSDITTFEPVTLTEKGLLLQSKMQTGEKLKIVRVAIGDGFLPEGQDKKKLLQLVHEIATPYTDTEGTSTTADIVYNQLNDAGSVITRIKIQNGDSDFSLGRLVLLRLTLMKGKFYTHIRLAVMVLSAYRHIMALIE